MDLIKHLVSQKRILALLVILFQYNTFYAQDQVLPVWPDGIPGAIANENYKEEPVHEKWQTYLHKQSGNS